MAFDSKDTAAFKGVWVFCEQREGVIMSTSYQLLSEGRKLANDLGVELCGVVLGKDIKEDYLKALGGYGADKVYYCNHELLDVYTTDAYTKVICDLVEDKKVVVLQAKTVPQGISAMIAMNPDGEEAENTAAMEEAMGQVTTMEITYAARDSSFDGNAIQAGDYLLLVDNQLFGTEKSMETALEKLAQESQERGGEFISIFYGEGVQQGEAEQALAQFEAACPEAEITLLEGGQPVYHYLISVE